MMTHPRELLLDQPSPEQAVRATERAEYLERLREKLKGIDTPVDARTQRIKARLSIEF